MKIILSALSFCLTITCLHAQEKFTLNEVYEIKKAGTLFLQSEDADVTITGSNRTDVKVSVKRVVTGKQITNEGFDLRIEEKNGNLHITEVSENQDFNYRIGVNSTIDYTIDIDMPINTSLDISGDDDDYNIASINGDLKLHSEDGDVLLENIQSEEAKIKLEDGDLQIKDFAGVLKFDIEDGNLYSDNSFYTSIDIDTEDGNVKIKNGSIGNCKIDAVDGDIVISSDFTSDAKVNITAEDGDIRINAGGDGGTYLVNYSDGDVDYSDDFSVTNNGKHQKTFRTTRRGNIDVKISVEDGDVTLNSND